jgi:hypothetical protein
LPKCPETLITRPWVDSQHDILVRGTLGMTDKGGITASGCPPPLCCEQHERLLQLRSDQGLLFLLLADDYVRLTCKGDQSLICCGVPINVHVVVRGKLSRNEGSPSYLEIREPEICEL